MNKILSGLMIATVSVSLTVSSLVPVQAAPKVAPSLPPSSQDVTKVGEQRWIRNFDRMNSDHMRYSVGEGNFGGREWRRWNGGNGWRGDNGWRGENGWRGNNGWRGAEWRGNGGDHRYWRGHRGYRNWRHGYREYNGWWYPLAAFTAGAVIGNVISQPRIYEGGGDAHTEWCYNRYRSYRAYDNTFQPYNGPRRQCYSPYG